MAQQARPGMKLVAPFLGPALVQSRGREAFGRGAADGVAVDRVEAAAANAGAAVLTAAGCSSATAAASSMASGFLGTHFGAGCIAGGTSIAVTYPLGKLVTRQQVDGHGARTTARHMAREGAGALYKGAQPLLLQRGLQIGTMYGVYAKFHERLSGSSAVQQARTPDWALRFAAGGLAGATDALVLTPLERIQTVMQLRAGARGNSLAGSGCTSSVAIALARFGPREFYRGVGTATIRNGACTGCYFLLMPHARSSWASVRETAVSRQWTVALPLLQNSRAEDFLCGVGLGCGMSVFVFPMSTLMKRQQVRTGGAHLSIAAALQKIVARGGYRAVYCGLPAFTLKSAVAWGVTNTVFTTINTAMHGENAKRQ